MFEEFEVNGLTLTYTTEIDPFYNSGKASPDNWAKAFAQDESGNQYAVYFWVEDQGTPYDEQDMEPYEVHKIIKDLYGNSNIEERELWWKAE